MPIITTDFETYYASSYSLKKLSTEAYIRDPRFEVIGVSIAINGGKSKWYAGNAVAPALAAIDWSASSLLAYNTSFDGAILGWHYGHYPALYLDAMGMARACGTTFAGASLKAVAEALGLGAKGDYVVGVLGLRLKDFTPQMLHDYGMYCCNDTDLTTAIYRHLNKNFPLSELLVQDCMLRMFIQPLLHFDITTLNTYHTEVVEAKWKALAELAQTLGMEYEGHPVPNDPYLLRQYDTISDGAITDNIKSILMSAPKFAALLEQLGVDPPMKISPTTGRETYAFAKTDAAFLELLDVDDVKVQAAVAARLGVRSTIEETRAKAFIDIAERGTWPVQYNYWKAVSSRFTGGGDTNPQNLKRGGRLRMAILPPAGHVLCVADLGQIECRCVNFIAGQDDVVQAFRLYDAGEGPDVYCIFASKIYQTTITPDDKEPRQVGKTGELSLGYGGGKKAYKRMLFAQAGLHRTLNESQKVVDIYRGSHQHVKALWYQGDAVLSALVQGVSFTFGKFGILDGSDPAQGIGLPSGAFIRLPKLQRVMDKQGQVHFYYTTSNKQHEIYGAMLVAICIQALARLAMTEAMLRIAKRYRVVMMLHDEITLVVPAAEVEEAKILMHTEMTRPLTWAPDLPLACSVGAGENYGAAK